jgi:hypothetical protein
MPGWSRDKPFAAMMSEKELHAGEEWAFFIEDVVRVEPGEYSVLATVTGRPAPPPVRGDVVVAPV